MLQSRLLQSLVLVQVLDHEPVTGEQISDSVLAGETADEEVEEEEGEEGEEAVPAEEDDAEVDGSQLEDEGRGQQGELRENARDHLQQFYGLLLYFFYEGLLFILSVGVSFGVADDLVASLTDQQEAGDH